MSEVECRGVGLNLWPVCVASEVRHFLEEVSRPLHVNVGRVEVGEHAANMIPVGISTLGRTRCGDGYLDVGRHHTAGFKSIEPASGVAGFDDQTESRVGMFLYIASELRGIESGSAEVHQVDVAVGYEIERHVVYLLVREEIVHRVLNGRQLGPVHRQCTSHRALYRLP